MSNRNRIKHKFYLKLEKSGTHIFFLNLLCLFGSFETTYIK